MRKLEKVTRSESKVYCDLCGRTMDTPIEQAESINIDKYDFHKNCLIKIIKKQCENYQS